MRLADGHVGGQVGALTSLLREWDCGGRGSREDITQVIVLTTLFTISARPSPQSSHPSRCVLVRRSWVGPPFQWVWLFHWRLPDPAPRAGSAVVSMDTNRGVRTSERHRPVCPFRLVERTVSSGGGPRNREPHSVGSESLEAESRFADTIGPVCGGGGRRCSGFLKRC